MYEQSLHEINFYKFMFQFKKIKIQNDDQVLLFKNWRNLNA